MHFFINKAMGIGNSGVEHAQFYRAKRFDEAGLPYKFIFMELVKNLHEAMEAWQIPDEKVINMWELFVLGPDYLAETPLPKITYQHDVLIDETNTHRLKTTQTSSGMLVLEHLEKSPSRKKKDLLLVSEYKVELFEVATKKRKVMFSYLNDPHRGRVMTNIHLYDFEGEHRFFQNEILLQRFFLNYLLTKFPDTESFVIDRGEESEAALFPQRPPGVKLIEIIHADHLSDRDEPTAPLWNNYYEYLLTHLERVDRVVVATELQREDLLVDFPTETEKFVTIPVGGIRNMTGKEKHTTKKQAEKFVTVSRLAAEKHLDIVIKAIVNAKKQYPNISLDIYGQGSEDSKLRKLIQSLNAEAFIRLKGHSNQIEKIYPAYDAFISGSYSEGFGLTYIEALNAGLPIVTFRARFGAMELVQEGKNGFLKDFSRTDETYSIDQLTAGIHQLLAEDLETLVQNTRQSVYEYQDTIIAEKWKELYRGL